MALGCSIAGPAAPNEVLRLVEAGVDAVGIVDTVGDAGPKQVGDLTKAAVKLAGRVHLHDTRGMGIANHPQHSTRARASSTVRWAQAMVPAAPAS